MTNVAIKVLIIITNLSNFPALNTKTSSYRPGNFGNKEDM